MRSTTVLVAAKPEFSFIELDAALGKEFVHGDLALCAVFEHFWLIECKVILKLGVVC